MKSLSFFLLVLLIPSCSLVPGLSIREEVTPVGVGTGPKVLCVVAHPDDEISFGGTIYKTSTFLNGVCDVVVLTNGEGGYKYSTLGEVVYGLSLTDEAVGRAHLPEIRRKEMIEGCRFLRVRNVHFLDEKDHRYTTDISEVMSDGAKVWDLPRVRGYLRDLMVKERYDFLLTLAPTLETHAHHKSAAILSLEALKDLPAMDRPVAMCVRTVGEEDPRPQLVALPGYPVTEIRDSPPFSFDRTQSFGRNDRLSYAIVINWAIAAHKSQGTMQLLMNRGAYEHYYLFALNSADCTRKAEDFFASLREKQFPTEGDGSE